MIVYVPNHILRFRIVDIDKTSFLFVYDNARPKGNLGSAQNNCTHGLGTRASKNWKGGSGKWGRVEVYTAEYY